MDIIILHKVVRISPQPLRIPELDEDTVIGFFDEPSLQTKSNTQRLWSFTKPTIYKNTTRLWANSFGFYALNGNLVIDFKENLKKESVCEFLASYYAQPTSTMFQLSCEFNTLTICLP